MRILLRARDYCPSRSLSRPPTRSNTPPGARGLSLAGFVISCLVNPGLISVSRARAVHQLGGAAGGRDPRFVWPGRPGALPVAGGRWTVRNVGAVDRLPPG